MNSEKNTRYTNSQTLSTSTHKPKQRSLSTDEKVVLTQAMKSQGLDIHEYIKHVCAKYTFKICKLDIHTFTLTGMSTNALVKQTPLLFESFACDN